MGLRSAVLTFVLASVLAGGAARAETPVVSNPAKPLDGTRIVELEELWRVGADDEDVLLGVIVHAISGADGQTYLLDRQLAQIVVIDADGEFVTTISREGEGPGELVQPKQLLRFPDGSLGVIDQKPGTITRLAVDGTPLDAIHLTRENGEPEQNARPLQARVAGGTLAVTANDWNYGGAAPVNLRWIGTYTLDGAYAGRMAAKESGFDFGNRSFDEAQHYFVEDGRWALTRDGRVHAATSRDAYRIETWDGNGQLVQILERAFDPIVRTDEQKKNVEAGLTMTVNGEKAPLRAEVLPNEPCISGLIADPSGWLLVRHGRSREDLPDDVAFRVDAFDPDGRFREVRAFTGVDYEPGRDRFFPLDDGRWIQVRNYGFALSTMFGVARAEEDEDETDVEPLEVICYRPR